MKRVTKSRAWGWSSESGRTTPRIHWARISAPAGRFEVWVGGVLVAETTDRWMAEAILAAREA